MAKLSIVNSNYISRLDRLVLIDKEYQTLIFSHTNILNFSIEYVFLEAYKCWENFIEDIFVSYSKYNKPILGIKPGPYLKPKNEEHALDLLTLEKNYIDWTSPDNIISRAEICFKNSQMISDPIKLAVKDLRDSKKLRNCIAHGSKESIRIFDELCRSNIGTIGVSPGEYLNTISPDRINNYNVYYLNIFKDLVNQISL
jgi:hypothetical protein